MLALVTVLVAIGFLANEARPALSSTGLKNFFTTTIWNGFIGQFGILGVMVGTMIIATIAMIVAVPAGGKPSPWARQLPSQRVAVPSTTTAVPSTMVWRTLPRSVRPA
jgi:ABC-type phosphate transport system permease subunit